MNIDSYSSVPYLDFGRKIEEGLDCWGMARHVLHVEFKKPLLQDFASVSRHCSNEIQGCFDNSIGLFKECLPKEGALACCFLKSGDHEIFHHVGVCINEHEVFHTTSAHGPQVLSVRAFKRLSLVVRFYEYVD